MFEQMISLPTIESINKFHEAIEKLDCDVDLVTQNFRYTVDAKSIMGIFSLDLSQPVIFRAYSDDPTEIRKIKSILESVLK